METTETKQVAAHATGSTGRTLPSVQPGDMPNFATYILCLWAFQGLRVDELLQACPDLMNERSAYSAGRIMQGYMQQMFQAAEQAIPFEHEWVLRLAETFDYNSEVDWLAIGDFVITHTDPQP